MNDWIKTIWTQTIGLFVDDGALALLVAIWIALVGAAVWAVGANNSSSWVIAAAFFFGLAAILVESVLRQTRKSSAARFTYE